MSDNILFRASSNGELMTSSGKSNAELLADANDQLVKSKNYLARLRDTTTTTYSNQLLKISQLHQTITILEPIKDVVELGETCKTKLRQIWREWKDYRTKEVSARQITKGIDCEEDSITLASLVLPYGIFFKNKDRFNNEYCSGLPDIFIKDGEKIDRVIDIKTSSDIFTFDDSCYEGLSKKYEWQLQTYMWLTGATKASLVYCAVNDTLEAINDAKFYLARRMNLIDQNTSPEFIEEAVKIERNRIFDMPLFMKTYPHAQLYSLKDWDYEIPAKERVHEIEILRDETKIQQLIEKVPVWRKYIQETFINNQK